MSVTSCADSGTGLPFLVRWAGLRVRQSLGAQDVADPRLGVDQLPGDPQA